MPKFGLASRNRTRNTNDDLQLDLFAFKTPTYENTNTDAIRTNGRDSLAGVPAEDGRGIGVNQSAANISNWRSL
jgi:hypothetical protein